MRAPVHEFILTPFGSPHPYHLIYVAQYRFVNQVGEFLVRKNLNGGIEAGLAEQWTLSNGGKTIRFTLRPNLYNSEEVAQSLRRLVRAGQTSHSNLSVQIEENGIQPLGPLELELKTRGDATSVLNSLVMADATILPDSHWRLPPGESQEQVDWTKVRGPYVYKSGSFPLEKGQSLTFTPNPDHYLFVPDQLEWNLVSHPEEQIQSIADLHQLLNSNHGYITLRHSELNPLNGTTGRAPSFYQTALNGVTFLLPNPNSQIMKTPVRQTLLRRISNSSFSILDPATRADQFLQPGLVGRMPDQEFAKIQTQVLAGTDHLPSRPLKCKTPANHNKKWISHVLTATGLPIELCDGSPDALCEAWKNGDYDLQFASVGMSDMDLMSVATFLFAPASVGLDLQDRPILKMLNGAKATLNREQILEAARKAFAVAYEKALVIPLCYTHDRHYFSDSIELNVNKNYAELVQIWNVRKKG